MSKQRLISEDYYAFLMMLYDDVGGVDGRGLFVSVVLMGRIIVIMDDNISYNKGRWTKI